MGEALHLRPITTSKTGGQLPINMPDGLGGWVTKLINTTDLLSGITEPTIWISNQGGNFTASIPAKYMVTEIYLIIANGTPTLSIGTTNFGTDILESTAMTSDIDIEQKIKFPTAGYIYFNVSNGNIDGRIDVKQIIQ